MRCTQFKKNIAAFVEGSQPACVNEQMDEHRTSCPRCRRLASSFSDHWQGLESFPEFSPVPGFESRVMQRLAAEDTRNRPERWVARFIQEARAPAILIVLIMAGVILGYQLGTYGQTGAADTSPASSEVTFLELTFGSSARNPLAGQASGSLEAAWLEMVATRTEANRP